MDLYQLSPEKKVPRLALHSLIGGAGRMGQIDRAFATFTEYSSLFSLEHDIRSYNALLYALARSYHPRVVSVLTILQDMESNGIMPDNRSFSLLLDVMAETRDMTAMSRTLALIRERRIIPLSKSLRKAAYVAAELQMDDIVEELKQLLLVREANHTKQLQPFFEETLMKKINSRPPPSNNTDNNV